MKVGCIQLRKIAMENIALTPSQNKQTNKQDKKQHRNSSISYKNMKYIIGKKIYNILKAIFYLLNIKRLGNIDIIMLLINLIKSQWVFHTSISWRSFTGVWVTAVRSYHQDFSQYSFWSCLDGFNSSSDFQFLHSFFQAFGDCSKYTTNN